MAHYFDDVFHRHPHVGPPKSPKMPPIRRSSTSRSISARSDFDTSVNGDAPYDDGVLSPGNSVEPDNPLRERERREANINIANYVSEQLQRVVSNDSLDFETNSDEYEAQLDEK